jgi:hypothetical protein
VPIEVRFGLAKVEITWIESTLYCSFGQNKNHTGGVGI